MVNSWDTTSPWGGAWQDLLALRRSISPPAIPYL